jgi:hypothetical protein
MPYISFRIQDGGVEGVKCRHKKDFSGNPYKKLSVKKRFSPGVEVHDKTAHHHHQHSGENNQVAKEKEFKFRYRIPAGRTEGLVYIDK